MAASRDGRSGLRHRRPLILVLGMHRSGTSLCSHVLSALGVDMADEIDAHPSNLKGHWERRELVALHDRILEHYNRGYYTQLHDFTLPVAWWAEPAVAEVRREIVAFLASRMGAAPFGFKDPRTARLLPLWHQICGELDLEPRIVFCLRNPAQVARSLQVRDGTDLDVGEARWFAYTIDLFRYAKNCDLCLLEYEAWFDEPAATLAKLRKFVGHSQLDGEFDPEAVVGEIIDAGLRHDDPQHQRARQPLVRSLYALARRADRDAAARAQILTVAAQYVGFDQLQRPFQRTFARNAELASRVPALEDAAATLRAVLAEREAALDTATREATASTARAEASEALAKETAAALAVLERERALAPRVRVAAQFAAAEAVQADLTRLRTALAAAESEASAQATETTRLRREIAELREHAAEVERELAAAGGERDNGAANADDTIADLTARLAQSAAAEATSIARAGAMLSEIDRQRDLLADLNRQSDAAALAAASAREEVARLRAELADAERRADDARTARDREMADLAARAAEQAAQAEASRLGESAARAELDGQRGMIAELTRQRDVARRSAADELDRLQAALSAAERDGAARTAEAAGAAAGRAAELAERLAERARGAAETEALLRTKLHELSADLAAAKRRDAWRAPWLRLRSVGAAIRAGDRASRSGDAAVAARHYRHAVERSPGLTAIWVQFGHALKELGDFAGAEAAYRRSLALDGSLADTHLQLGHLLKLQARWIAAADTYARALELDPGLGAAAAELDGLAPRLVEVGDTAADARDWATAAGSYRRALDRQPAATDLWIRLGDARAADGDDTGAEAAYRRALALDGALAESHVRLLRLLQRQARWEEAADACAEALRRAPEREEILQERDELHRRLLAEGLAAGEREDWPRTAGLFRRALDLRPGEATTWLRLGQAQHRQGDNAAAEAACRRAIELDATLAEAHLHLGRLLARQGQRAAALDAYAVAVRLDGTSTAGCDGLRELVAETPAAADQRPEPIAAVASGRDVIWLCVIDWHYRIQRPQHLSAHLADGGARVFYISLVFDPPDGGGRFRIIGSPHRGVYEVRMRVVGRNVYNGLEPQEVSDLQRALDELISVLDIRAPIVVVDHPAWQPVACGVPGATVVYDCLDLATGFSAAAPSTAVYEAALLASADLVITASQPLADHVAPRRAGGVVIRNAADVDFFARGFSDRAPGGRPVIGYFGAIADWFNIEWIERCAAARPGWDFRLIGNTTGCDTARAAALPNVCFFGERPYQELPQFLHEFDVAVIPFKMVELIRCTNPVKLYEYMAAGKAVVAGPMPEVVAATDLVYIADDAVSFIDRIEQALAEDSPALRLRRLAWARQHTWASRASALARVIDAAFPLVSVIVLTYNNWRFTEACLASLRSESDYPNLEIIVVDNASSDGTPEKLREIERQDDRIRVVHNDANLGFAAGNNVGLRRARGEFVILLNNDTVVTRGWVRDLIRPMQLDPGIGLAGPLTNDIGNEQKLSLMYGDLAEMHEVSRRVVRARLRRRFDTSNLAFFCVAIRRDVLDEVGLLDEAYGVGFFEDDDYCRRVRQAGWRLVIADDVFVHHYLSVSFHALGEERAELLARNKAIFESRWGPWEPHRYRDEPGFG